MRIEQTDGIMCDHCHKTIERPPESIGTGYARNDKGEYVCYACCADIDRQYMIDNGQIDLYLLVDSSGDRVGTGMHIANWPNTLRFPVLRYSKSKHACFGGYVKREDAWFAGPDAHIWHGVVRGDMQLARCKRTKRTRL